MILILYVLVVFLLISTYRKLIGNDNASLEFQRRIEERIRATKLLRTIKEFKGVLLVGIIVGIILIMFSALKLMRLIF